MRPFALLLFIFTINTSLVNAQDTLTASENVLLYAGPGTTFEQVGQLNIDQPFTVQARTRLGNWVRLTNPNDPSIAGWVMTGKLPLDQNIALSDIPAVNTPDADLERVDVTYTPRILYETPILPTEIHAELLTEVFERGLEKGNDPFSVVKAGDCNTASGMFLTPISTGEYRLGAYDYLADTVEKYHESFGRRSIASRDGFNVSSIFDPIWAMGADCNPNEPPLLCEYRNNPSSVAFMMFGQNDILVLNREQYETYLRDAVERSLEYGVIPVLSTFTNRPENEDNWHQVLAMNEITIKVANDYGIPLINFWLAAQSLPGRGIGGDYAHLTVGGEQITFDGREAEYGLTLYNLAVLNMLDMIYHDIIEE